MNNLIKKTNSNCKKNNNNIIQSLYEVEYFLNHFSNFIDAQKLYHIFQKCNKH